MTKRGKCSKRLFFISAKTKSPNTNEVGKRKKRMTLLIHQPDHLNTGFQVAFIQHFPDLSAIVETMVRIDYAASY